ncbi:Flagellar transcriptional activator FlhD [Candidatus Sodalis pierantonius str. SOPE]|uniref:Flagellar transcriptional regulator FlhD n=1 Tax=Candidatus Sodalis pierantonii str. SOPE TaxID=2342 RepID=W0HS32_9GAMM|nr:flagellar transcriptional regulator FlhD [Candidatus Sodalis pierantonius]AHF74928.1 Flagellar transcriptional activator FlhD [Candidatus Sodalis pierantonius str. SOPE]
MNTSEVLKNIYGINLSYLSLAQRLIQTDKSSAMFRLGISEPMAETLQKLTMAQMVKLAETNQLLCVFRFEDPKAMTQLTQDSRVEDLNQIHASILLSSRLNEQLTTKAGSTPKRKS